MLSDDYVLIIFRHFDDFSFQGKSLTHTDLLIQNRTQLKWRKSRVNKCLNSSQREEVLIEECKYFDTVSLKNNLQECMNTFIFSKIFDKFKISILSLMTLNYVHK